MSPRPLTPNHILTMKSTVVLSPPGSFVREDYLRKKWRRVQYMLDQFQARWKRELLQSLQSRQKWLKPHQNLEKGDIVLLCDENIPRNQWSLGRIENVMPSKDGFVRSVSVRIADDDIDKKGKRTSKHIELQLPVHKLVLLLENETRASSPKSLA